MFSSSEIAVEETTSLPKVSVALLANSMSNFLLFNFSTPFFIMFSVSAANPTTNGRLGNDETCEMISGFFYQG